MKPLDDEKHFPAKRKALLHRLREHNWDVIGVDDSEADWALDVKWVIESSRENKGSTLTLWFFKYDGLHDGMNRVVVTRPDDSQPNAYGGEPSLDFDSKRFEMQLQALMTSLNTYRISGRLAVAKVEGRRKR